jgi:hypothetical protein
MLMEVLYCGVYNGSSVILNDLVIVDGVQDCLLISGYGFANAM